MNVNGVTAQPRPPRFQEGETGNAEQKLIVQKFGGTCLATTEKISAIARRIVATRRQGHRVVVVASAMGHTTDQLLEMVRQVAADPHRRELDVLLSTGELTSAALLAMAIRDLGEEAISLTGAQCGIVTNGVHSNARILRIRTARLRHELARGAIVVVAGFQGVSPSGEVTTLGRGGSDTTASALAAVLVAHACQIFTDVDCVFTADPRKVPGAQPLHELHCDEMQEMAWHGAQVMKAEAVEFAKTNGVGFEIGSPFSDAPGSWIWADAGNAGREDAVFEPRRREVAGVSGRTDLLRLTCDRAALGEDSWESFVHLIAGYDLVFGRLDSRGRADLLLSDLEIPDPEKLSRDFCRQFAGAVSIARNLGAVSLIGFGLGSRPAAFLDALRVLEKAGHFVLDSFTSRESLSFLMEATSVREGVEMLHHAFIESRPVPAVMDDGTVHQTL